MTDAQMLTIAIAIIFPLSMLLYSNSRISEAKETLRADMALGFERVMGAIKGVETKLEIHELEHHRK